ncbi:hypothetical protein A2Z22_01415 [Candidatus Woesebacteria bacterium RBG_16_34_12]|uniref:Uncharacterized protein n=1 Tax=Candidatus Woesebacteria bacterium RBG_16_34_12 TaxID=1802480 RepID=A0A1F7XA13_9BACT|nr:MAG: hypothetical protein A2Z22_01415 [Candidatus Woesebacteria bacterium RBG_16_34_12]
MDDKLDNNITSTPNVVDNATMQPQVKNEAEIGKPVLKKIPMRNTKETMLLIVGSLLVVLAGIGTGWFLSGSTLASRSSKGSSEVTTGAEKSETEAGIADEATFRDTAEGKLVEGGVDGEGTHHLERGLGPEKDVYLTSTVIDLQSFVDKKVQIWGETITARKAGWLMDVGKIKVIE